MQWAYADATRGFGWVGLDGSENDPVVLWRYVLLSLRNLLPGLAEDAWAWLHDSTPDINEVLARLLNDLSEVPGRVVVVLDDYHLIENPECHEAVQHFIAHMPGSIELAFGTRIAPPLTLSNLQAHGLLTEIGPADLRLTREESRQVVKLTDGSVSVEDATSLHRGAEGWATGVYLGSICRSSDSDRNIGDHADTFCVRRYLAEEMLAPLPRSDLDFLTKTSILRRMVGPLCDVVTGCTDSSSRLASLAESNLLLARVDDGEWYRYHRLLSDALQVNFGRLAPTDRERLHRRAGQWWLERGEIDEAVHHAVAAGDYLTAVDLMGANWYEYVFTGRLETVRRWLGAVPSNVMFGQPTLIIAAAWVAALCGDSAEARRLTYAASRAAYEEPMLDGIASFESSIAMLEATLGFDGVSDARDHAETAYRLEPQGSAWRPVAAARVGMLRAACGDEAGARIALDEAVRARLGPEGTASYALGLLALFAESQGRWEEGSRYADRACEIIERLGIEDLPTSGAAYAAAASAAVHNGQCGVARKRLRFLAAAELRLADAIPTDAFQIHLVVSETYLALGDHRSAAVHAGVSAALLAAMGDGGVLEHRLEAVFAELDRRSPVDADTPVDGSACLTPRELEILGLLPTTLSLREIGSELYVSRNTVKTHVSRIYRKLEVASRSAAVVRATELELVE